MTRATLSMWVAVVFVSCFQTENAAAAVWNVNPAGTGDAPTIQAAYDLASPGDLIILAPGTYIDSHTRTIQGHSSPRTTTATAFMSPGVDITSSAGADFTFIDGQDVRHGLFGVDVGGVNISEITFVHCARAGGEIWGGGMMFHRSSPVVEHCRFLDNDAWAAGGVFVSQGSGAIIRFNTFIRNSGGDLAGAVEIFQHSGAFIQNNTFVFNSVGHESGGGEPSGRRPGPEHDDLDRREQHLRVQRRRL